VSYLLLLLLLRTSQIHHTFQISDSKLCVGVHQKIGADLPAFLNFDVPYKIIF